MSCARDCPSPKRFLLFMFALIACPFAARAVDLDLKLEPSGALSMHKSQSQRFEFGGAACLAPCLSMRASPGSKRS